MEDDPYTIGIDYPADLVSEKLPDRLCKFHSINPNTLSTLRKEEIYIPSVGELNDPMESKASVELKPSIFPDRTQDTIIETLQIRQQQNTALEQANKK